MTKIFKLFRGSIIFLIYIHILITFPAKSGFAATRTPKKRTKSKKEIYVTTDILTKLKQKIEEIQKFKHFRNFLWNHEISYPKSGTYIFGDADGSFARVVLAAVISGYVEVSNSGLEILSRLLSLESDTLNRASGPEGEEAFTNFQKNTQIYNNIEALLSDMKYKKAKNKLIFLGDILFDRLTNNLNATIKLIECLHNQGVWFIKGNHDYIDAMDQIWRGYGIARDKSKEDKDEIKRIIDKCFTLAHYDDEDGVLYTHAAIGQNDTGGISYCSVNFQYIEGYHLKNEINQLADSITHENMRNSRPGTSYRYKPNQEKKYIPNDFLHIHGHQEHASEVIKDYTHYLSRGQVEGVLCVNARSSDGYLPVMMLLM
jgi:hypothetical protein